MSIVTVTGHSTGTEGDTVFTTTFVFIIDSIAQLINFCSGQIFTGLSAKRSNSALFTLSFHWIGKFVILI
jgi:hypothetical protein